jgi:hypothetical protein
MWQHLLHALFVAPLLTWFVLCAHVLPRRYSQGDDSSVPVLLVAYQGQAASMHGLGMYRLQAQ